MRLVYIEYANNYDAARDEFDRLSDNESFVRFCEAMELRDGLDLGLDDLMIMPVQRLPRYVMLLETLYKSVCFMECVATSELIVCYSKIHAN